MSSAGITPLFIGVQILNVGLVLIWPIMSVIALIMMRKRRIADIAQVIWVFIVIAIPLLGAAAFLIVLPGEAKLQV